MAQKKEDKRQKAQASVEAWRMLSPKQQMAILDERLGKGVGAVKQRAKIQSLIDAEKEG